MIVFEIYMLSLYLSKANWLNLLPLKYGHSTLHASGVSMYWTLRHTGDTQTRVGAILQFLKL